MKKSYLNNVWIIGLIGGVGLISNFIYLIFYIFDFGKHLSMFGLTFQDIGTDILYFFSINSFLNLLFGILTVINAYLIRKGKKLGNLLMVIIGIITIVSMFIIIRSEKTINLTPNSTLYIGEIRLLSNHTIFIEPFIVLIAGVLPILFRIDDWLISKDMKQLKDN